MRILVTGGAGFIGSNLVEKLVESGNDVFVLDNFHTGSMENLKNVRDRVKVLEGSVGEIWKFGLESIEVIHHLGIYSSSPMYRKDPSLVAKSIEDAIQLFEFARKNGCKVIVASTSSVYNGNPLPWKEEMPTLVKDFYTEARVAIERLGKLYHELYGIEVLVLRLFSVYGPKEEFKNGYANIITQFLWKMMKDEKPVIYGDGTQTRDFVYVEDVVDAFMLAAEKSFGYEIFNVGRGERKSFNEIVALLNEKLGKSIEPAYVENPIKNYVYHTLADTGKSKRLLKFKARVSVEEGIELLINYYSKERPSDN